MSPIRVPLFLIPARCRGASRLVFCFRRRRFVLLSSSCPQKVLMRLFEGMRDRPRFRGLRPALCNEGTT